VRRTEREALENEEIEASLQQVGARAHGTNALRVDNSMWVLLSDVKVS
jgi:hypothetical protein